MSYSTQLDQLNRTKQVYNVTSANTSYIFVPCVAAQQQLSGQQGNPPPAGEITQSMCLMHLVLNDCTNYTRYCLYTVHLETHKRLIIVMVGRVW